MGLARTLRGAALCSTLIVTACAIAPGYIGPNDISTRNGARRLQHHGFSVEPPRGSGWRVLINQQTPYEAIYRRRLYGPATHTFIARARLIKLREGLPFEQAAAPSGLANPDRMTLLEQTQEVYAGPSGPCLRYTARLADRGAPNGEGQILELVDRGIVCAHPTLSGDAVRILFSERGLPAELDDRLWEEHAAFLDSLRFDHPPTE